MANSTEVFALRKEGKINEAFEMASRLIEFDSNEDWNAKAFAYCLNDLIKKAVSENNYVLAQSYSNKFDLVKLDEYDEILIKTVKNAKITANPDMRIALQARQLSFDNRDQEALPLFKTAVSRFPNDKDLCKNYAWSLSKVLREAINSEDKILRNQLLLDYSVIEENIDDERLIHSMTYLKDLADDERQIIRDAKEKSRNGNHQEALDLFRQAIRRFPDDIDLNEQFAWELQKEGKIIFEGENIDTLKVRTLLAEYMRLKNKRPSQLHSMFLRFADKIMDKEDFNFVAFLRLWDLKNLRTEDFESFKKEDKTYSSIAEKVIQHGGKLILNKKMSQEVETFLPFLDLGIEKFQDNIWLTYYKAKLLYLINRNEEAIQFLIPVVKEKISEYWTWNLLAELFAETESKMTISCYCKSLLCKSEEKFLTNVRVKFVDLLVSNELWKEAKTEIELIIQAKEAEGKSINEKLINYQSKGWYKEINAAKNNFDFYNSNRQVAEEFIFHSLPWFEACIGESFTIPDNPNRPRRKFFIKLPIETIEIVISERKFNTSRGFQFGSSIRIKGEFDKDKNFQIYLLEKRETTEQWDIFDDFSGNAIHSLKNDSDKIVAWKVVISVEGQLKEGIINVENIRNDCKIVEGMPLNIKYFQKAIPIQRRFTLSYEKEKVHILSISERTNGKLWDSFPEHIGIIDHINQEKGIAHFIVNKTIGGVAKAHQIKGRFEVGSKLLVQLKKVVKEKESYYSVLTCELTDKEPIEKVIRDFSGIIDINGAFGFADSVFIDFSFISKHQIQDSEYVKGVAILNYNKKRGEWGWKAISVSSNSNNS